MHDQAWLPVWTFAFWTKKPFFCTLWPNPFWSCILIYVCNLFDLGFRLVGHLAIPTWRLYKFDMHDQAWLPVWTFAFWTKKPFFCTLWQILFKVVFWFRFVGSLFGIGFRPLVCPVFLYRVHFRPLTQLSLWIFMSLPDQGIKPGSCKQSFD